MDIELLSNKIYLIKTRTIPPGFSFDVHYCRWVSPRATDLRIDKRIDVPYPNITFVEAHCTGDHHTGDRFIDIGVAGFPKLFRMPFAALSPNEFRFPSKNIDHSIRHAVTEIIKNGRILSMGEDMFRFLTGKSILCLENPIMVEAHVGALFSLVRDKVPFRCDSCRKFLWIAMSKLPARPTKARCPACTFMLQIETPKGIDLKLKRFIDEEAHRSGKTGDIIVSQTGQIMSPKTAEIFGGLPLLEGTGVSEEEPIQTSGEKDISKTTDMARASTFDLDIDSILGGRKTETPAPAPATEAPPPSRGTPVDDLELDFGDNTPIDFDQTSAPRTPAHAGAAPSIELDDDFISKILPSSAPAKAASAEPAAAEPAPAPAAELETSHPGLVEIPKESSGRICPVCGEDVGDAKICPACHVEQFDSLRLEETNPGLAASAEVENALMEEFQFETSLQESVPSPAPVPEQAPAAAESQKREGEEAPKSEGPIPFWEEKVWSLKIGEEYYTDLDIRTVEEWIHSGSVIETDMVRKGETRWAEIGTVPYFRQAFAMARNSVPLDGTDQPLYAPATMNQRMTAFLIDAPIVGGLAAAGFFLGRTISSEGITFSIILAVALPLIYLATGNGILGITVGKSIMKIRVIGKSGMPIGFVGGLIRTVSSLVTVGIGFLWASKAKYNQSFYDKAANCYVVSTE